MVDHIAGLRARAIRSQWLRSVLYHKIDRPLRVRGELLRGQDLDINLLRVVPVLPGEAVSYTSITTGLNGLTKKNAAQVPLTLVVFIAIRKLPYRMSSLADTISAEGTCANSSS